MISVRIEADTAKLARELAAVRAKVALAVARGLNEGGDKVRTQVRAAMLEQTSLVRLNSVTGRERTMRAYSVGAEPKSGIGPARPASLQYKIIYSGKPTRIGEFKVKVQTGPGGGVTAIMWGKPHKFARSFYSPWLSYGGLRARLGKKRLPIRSFDGPNLAKEAVKGQVAETFLSLAPVLVPPMIEKHLAKLL